MNLVFRGLLICEFAYSHFKNWFKSQICIQSKCVFLSANSVFAVQSRRTYLLRITWPTCMYDTYSNDFSLNWAPVFDESILSFEIQFFLLNFFSREDSFSTPRAKWDQTGHLLSIPTSRALIVEEVTCRRKQLSPMLTRSLKMSSRNSAMTGSLAQERYSFAKEKYTSSDPKKKSHFSLKILTLPDIQLILIK